MVNVKYDLTVRLYLRKRGLNLPGKDKGETKHPHNNFFLLILTTMHLCKECLQSSDTSVCLNISAVHMKGIIFRMFPQRMCSPSLNPKARCDKGLLKGTAIKMRYSKEVPLTERLREDIKKTDARPL